MMGGAQNIISIDVTLIDISERRIVSQFSTSGPASNRIFETVDKATSRIADEAQTILPNETEWQQISAEKRRPAGYLTMNRIDLQAGYHIISDTGRPDTLAYGSSLSTSALQPAASLNLAYRRKNFLFNNTLLNAELHYTTAAGDYYASGHDRSQKIRASQNTYSLNAGPGYRLFTFSDFDVEFMLTGGYSYQQIELNYGDLSVKPLDSSGSEVAVKNYSYLIPQAGAQLQINYHLTGLLSLNTALRYRHLFYESENYGYTEAALGLGAAF